MPVLAAAWLGCVGGLLAAAPAAPPPGAEPTEARRYITAAATLYASLDNDRALEQLEQARKLTHTLQETILISLYEGLIFSDNGRKDDSEAAFRGAFALEPDAAVPVRISPKLQDWVEQIRADVKKKLARNAPHLAEQLAPPREAPPAAIAPAPAAEVERSASVRSRAWVPAVAGAVLLAGAGTMLYLEQDVEARLRSPASPVTSAAQLDQTYQQGRLYTGLGWSLAGAGAGALALAGGMYLWGDDSGVQVSAAGSPGGGGVQVRGRW